MELSMYFLLLCFFYCSLVWASACVIVGRLASLLRLSWNPPWSSKNVVFPWWSGVCCSRARYLSCLLLESADEFRSWGCRLSSWSFSPGSFSELATFMECMIALRFWRWNWALIRIVLGCRRLAVCRFSGLIDPGVPVLFNFFLRLFCDYTICLAELKLKYWVGPGFGTFL